MQPMDDNSTPSNQSLKILLRDALKAGDWGTPSDSLIGFIRNYSLSSHHSV